VSKPLSRLGLPHAPASDPMNKVAAHVTPNVKSVERRFCCMGTQPPAARKNAAIQE
jgi:hypothetical protein